MAKAILTMQEKTDAYNELTTAETEIAAAKAALNGLTPTAGQFQVPAHVGAQLDRALEEAKGKATLAAIDLGGKPCGGGRPC